ncbi:hypothetical protein SAMN05444166_2829 [Singulisphaera sp. GP187]|nr:hypothetical protein SAMN05444166_2829 [Singulisphaera sp. GP187]
MAFSGCSKDAFGQIHEKLKLRRSPKRGRNVIVALMSVIYPNVVWGGCIKTRIGSSELPDIISRLVATNVLSWIDNHPEAAQELAQMQIFQFPDAWYSEWGLASDRMRAGCPRSQGTPGIGIEMEGQGAIRSLSSRGEDAVQGHAPPSRSPWEGPRPRSGTLDPLSPS